MGLFATRKKYKAIYEELIPIYEKLNGTEFFFNINYKKGFIKRAPIEHAIASIYQIEQMLFDGEKIERMTLPDNPNTFFVLACTQERVLAVSGPSGSKKEEARYDEIISVTRPGLFVPLKVETISGQSIDTHFLSFHIDAIDQILKYLQNRVAEVKKTKNITTNSSSTISDSDEIEKLYNLKAKGIITEEEFEHKKKELLGL